MANKTLTKELKEYIARPKLERSALTTSKANLEKDLEAIEKIDLGIESEAKIDVYNQRLTNVYCTLDPSFLSMKHPDVYKDTHDDARGIRAFKLSLPKFAIYSLNSPICSFKMSISYRDKKKSLEIVEFKVTSPNLPSFLEKSILKSLHLTGKDVVYEYGGNSISTTDFEFKSIFKGIIPEVIKKSIGSARRSFGKEIYVIAEADNWKSKKVPSDDPLIIGVKGKNCYLIEAFETTPMEEYVRREFSFGGLNG